MCEYFCWTLRDIDRLTIREYNQAIKYINKQVRDRKRKGVKRKR